MTRPYRLDDGPVVLAVDIGTSRTKVGLIAARSGPVAAVVAGPTPRDPHRLLSVTASLIDEVIEGSPVPVSSVAFSSYWHGLVCVNSDDEPMGAITTWQNTSASASSLLLAERMDPADYHNRTGCFLHPSYPYSRIHMLSTSTSRHEVRWLMSPADWLFARFFGEYATSPSMVSGTGLAAIGGQTYDQGLFDAAEVAASELPEITQDPLSGLLTEWGERWPSLASIPWHLPVGDGACSSLGSGCVDRTRAALNLGTSGAVRVLSEGFPDPPDGSFVYTAPGNRSLVGGATSNAGNVIQWARQTLRLPDDALDTALSMKTPQRLRVEAHLAGQRAPHWPIDATGRIEGIGLATSAVDLLSAIVASVVDDLASIVVALDTWLGDHPAIVASGGLFEANDRWAQALSERIGRPLHRARSNEAGLLGAVGFALESTGISPEPQELLPM